MEKSKNFFSNFNFSDDKLQTSNFMFSVAMKTFVILRFLSEFLFFLIFSFSKIFLRVPSPLSEPLSQNTAEHSIAQNRTFCVREKKRNRKMAIYPFRKRSEFQEQVQDPNVTLKLVAFIFIFLFYFLFSFNLLTQSVTLLFNINLI